MAENEEEMSPEEKLLKVIQEGAEEDQEKQGAPADPEEGGEVADGKKLRVAAEPAAVGADAAAEEPEQLSAPEEAQDVVPGAGLHGRGWGGSGLRRINRILLLVALVMLVLSALQFWAHVQALESVPVSRAAPHGTGPTRVGSGSPASVVVDSILQAFADKPLFDYAEPVELTAQTAGGAVSTQVTGWRRYVAENLDLLGLSGDSAGGQEAIIVDRKEDRMHIVREGQSFRVGEKKLTLDEISEKEVVVTDGAAGRATID